MRMGKSPFNLSEKQLNLQHLEDLGFILLTLVIHTSKSHVSYYVPRGTLYHNYHSSPTRIFTRLLLRPCVGCPKQHLLKLSYLPENNHHERFREHFITPLIEKSSSWPCARLSSPPWPPGPLSTNLQYDLGPS